MSSMKPIQETFRITRHAHGFVSNRGGRDPRPRALVVEDEENVAYLVQTALRLNGWETSVAGTGRSAQVLMRDFDPNVIVLDVMLPDVSGFALCERLRRTGVDTPMIFLTARDGTQDRVKGLTIGGDDYLTKPFSVEELVARCRLLLRRSMSDTPRMLAYEELSMNEDAHLVIRGGQRVALSPTEYKLLRYLLLNAERVLTRTQILDHVWGYDFQGDGSNVETYISFLRKKVDALGPRLIHTVRGVGYVLRLDEG
jgi:two-component system OmpR family response regulator